MDSRLRLWLQNAQYKWRAGPKHETWPSIILSTCINFSSQLLCFSSGYTSPAGLRAKMLMSRNVSSTPYAAARSGIKQHGYCSHHTTCQGINCGVRGF